MHHGSCYVQQITINTITPRGVVHENISWALILLYLPQQQLSSDVIEDHLPPRLFKGRIRFSSPIRGENVVHIIFHEGNSAGSPNVTYVSIRKITAQLTEAIKIPPTSYIYMPKYHNYGGI